MSPRTISVLSLAGEPTTPKRLADRAGVPQQLVAVLVDSGLLIPAVRRNAMVQRLGGWSPFELAVQRQSGYGRRRATPLDASDASPVHMSSRISSTTSLKGIASNELVDKSWVEVLRSRRSRRRFGKASIPLSKVAALLLETAATQFRDPKTGTVFRPYPSAGGLHPLTLYLIPLKVPELAPAIYRFQPDRGALGLMANEGTLRSWILAGVNELDHEGRIDGEPGVVLIITADFRRTMARYERLGLTLVYRDVGCLIQTLYLQVTAMDLAGFAIGGGPEMGIARALGLDPLSEAYVGMFLIGSPA